MSIAVPTYNRAGTLGRALESALSQTWSNTEIIISDNASADETEELCQRYAERDLRIRYVRQRQNLGPTSNFNFLFGACRGEFVQMLADDDWLDPDYVETCLDELRRRADHVLVAGLARYYRGGQAVAEGVPVQVREDSACDRVVSYYRQVEDNGTFYGLVRSQTLRAAGPMCNELGNDWFHLASIAFQGKLGTLRGTHVNRDLGGTSDSVESIVAIVGGSRGVELRLPHVFIAARAAREIRGGSAYRTLGPLRRAGLSFRVVPAIINWRSLAWHSVAPTFARLSKRPRGRALWRAFVRVTRLLGAGQTPFGSDSSG